jgi:hypothetical protein
MVSAEESLKVRLDLCGFIAGQLPQQSPTWVMSEHKPDSDLRTLRSPPSANVGSGERPPQRRE